jgi:hypothetical protein
VCVCVCVNVSHMSASALDFGTRAHTHTHRIYGVGGAPGEGTSVTNEAACEEEEVEEYQGVAGEHGKCVRVSTRGVEEVFQQLGLAPTQEGEGGRGGVRGFARTQGGEPGTALHLEVCPFLSCLFLCVGVFSFCLSVCLHTHAHTHTHTQANCEGCEFELLETLLDLGLARRFASLTVHTHKSRSFGAVWLRDSGRERRRSRRR